MKEYLEKLNVEQKQAATIIDGHLLIIAGAGTGKTSCLVSRVANMLDEDIPPENILLLTFTKKAANEMKTRISNFEGINPIYAAGITACTFHSFCYEQLRKYAHLLGYTDDFDIYDENDALDSLNIIIKSQLEKYDDDKRYETFPSAREIMKIYETSVSNLTKVEDVLENTELNMDPAFFDDIKEIIDNYKDFKKQRNRMDYEDMLMNAYILLKNHETVRRNLDKRYKYIMCDEYQDTNIIQDRILDLLSKDYPNLCVVGDDNQSIYRFRGACIENILSFAKRHNGCKQIKLTQNYRSTQEILDFANAIMSHAEEGIPKKLSGLTSGNKVSIKVYENDMELSSNTVKEIKAKIDEGYKPNEICIMGRNGRSTFFVETELQRNHIPYEKTGGPSYFDMAIVRDVMAFMRVINIKNDELAWLRVLNMMPGIATKKSQNIYKDVEANGYSQIASVTYTKEKGYQWLKALSDLINDNYRLSPGNQLDNVCKYYERLKLQTIMSKRIGDDKIEEQKLIFLKSLKDLETLKILSKEYISAREMIADFAFNVPDKRNDRDKVKVTTIHSAKGLEFDDVYLINPINGIMPKKQVDCPDTREDLRCLYVAITRPRNNLTICFAKVVQIYGKEYVGKPSLFFDYPDVLDTADYPDDFEEMLHEPEIGQDAYIDFD